MSRYATPPCPLDAAHGHLLDFQTATAGFYCPARAHEGRGPFYRTDLSPAPRPAREVFSPSPARGPRRQRATEPRPTVTSAEG